MLWIVWGGYGGTRTDEIGGTIFKHNFCVKPYENPERTQVIVGSMNTGYCHESTATHNLFRSNRGPILLGHNDVFVVENAWILWRNQIWNSSNQRSARAGFCRPGPARPVDLTARPGPARGPEFEFRARPVSARGMAKPGPARPGPVGSGPTKQFPWDFLKLFNLIKQSLFNGFVGYLFVTDAPQGWIPTCICKKYIDQRWKNYYYNWEIRTL